MSDIHAEEPVERVERKMGLQFAAQQHDAVPMAAQHKPMVITGGPGVGKTTLVNAIVKVMQAKQLA